MRVIRDLSILRLYFFICVHRLFILETGDPAIGIKQYSQFAFSELAT
jgi:hypothetical protein